MLAVRAARTGGPEVLEVVDLPVPEPGPGQLRIRQHAIGINFIDTYFRSGLYPMRMPAVLGQEGAGVVDAIGEGVAGWAPGDRVYAGQAGAYAELTLASAARAIRLPDGVSFEVAAAGMLNDGLALTSPPSRYSASIVWLARVSNSRVASPRRFFHR